ncbi:MAG: hypothetical protein MHM6MM_001724 [Cercozoa sp. M6MM]
MRDKNSSPCGAERRTVTPLLIEDDETATVREQRGILGKLGRFFRSFAPTASSEELDVRVASTPEELAQIATTRHFNFDFSMTAPDTEKEQISVLISPRHGEREIVLHLPVLSPSNNSNDNNSTSSGSSNSRSNSCRNKSRDVDDSTTLGKTDTLKSTNIEASEIDEDDELCCRYCYEDLPSDAHNFSVCHCSGMLCRLCLQRELALTLSRQNGVMQCTVCKYEPAVTRSLSASAFISLSCRSFLRSMLLRRRPGGMGAGEVIYFIMLQLGMMGWLLLSALCFSPNSNFGTVNVSTYWLGLAVVCLDALIAVALMYIFGGLPRVRHSVSPLPLCAAYIVRAWLMSRWHNDFASWKLSSPNSFVFYAVWLLSLCGASGFFVLWIRLVRRIALRMFTVHAGLYVDSRGPFKLSEISRTLQTQNQ